MSAPLLQIEGLSVRVEDKEILHGIDLQIKKGETHVLMGPNGAGKSTLGYALMGNPKYQITGGKILFEGKDISEETPDKRAKDGMFLSFQNPIEIPGVSLTNFIRSGVEQRTGKRIRGRAGDCGDAGDGGRDRKFRREVRRKPSECGICARTGRNERTEIRGGGSDGRRGIPGCAVHGKTCDPGCRKQLRPYETPFLR